MDLTFLFECDCDALVNQQFPDCNVLVSRFRTVLGVGSTSQYTGHKSEFLQLGIRHSRLVWVTPTAQMP